jgi:hypothetical protein
MKEFSAKPNQPPFKDAENPSAEKPDAFWYRIYAAVIVTTILVIAALWAFSRYFSK